MKINADYIEKVGFSASKITITNDMYRCETSLGLTTNLLVGYLKRLEVKGFSIRKSSSYCISLMVAHTDALFFSHLWHLFYGLCDDIIFYSISFVLEAIQGIAIAFSMRMYYNSF